jgi:hypothetical protein
MKKLLLGTALATLVAGVASAETKVSGYLETTIGMSSKATAGVTEDSNPIGIGHEVSIDMSTTKELDNGMTMSAGFGTEDGSATDQYLKLTSGAVTFAVGNDVTGVTDNVSQEDFTPHVAQDFHSAGLDSSAAIDGVKTTHGGNAMYLIYKTDMATIEANYTPDLQTAGTDSVNGSRAATATSLASGYDIAVKGNFGVEGLSAGYGVSKASATLSSTVDQEGKAYGASYTVGAFTVGYGKNESNAVNSALDTTVETYGVSYKVNDQISVSAAAGKVDKDGEATDEEHTTIQVGYDLGGMGITLGYYEAENVGYTAGTDVEKFEIRTVTKF